MLNSKRENRHPSLVLDIVENIQHFTIRYVHKESVVILQGYTLIIAP